MNENKWKSKFGRVEAPFPQAVKIKTETGGKGAIKTLIVAGILLAELALFIYLSVAFTLAFKWCLIASFVLSIITCVYILSSNKNSLSKAVWIIFTLLFFTIGYIIYLMSDERIFFRKHKYRYKQIYSSADKYLQPTEVKRENLIVERDCNYLYTSGKFKTYIDTKAQYFNSGTLLFDDVLERIKSAEKFIFMEFFILSDGRLLNRFYDLLSQAAARGVDVRLIYDDMGSHKTLSVKNKLRLKKAGIKICPFNRFVPMFSVALNYRDHRKMIIIDGKTAYTGGSNLADEYVNEKRMHGYWKDTGIRLDGRAVDGFTLMFLRQWEFINKKREDYSPFLNLADRVDCDSAVVPYADGLDYDLPICKTVYENMIASAQKCVYIMTPYFIVDDTIANLIVNKALSGVDVRIILPEIPDKKLVYSVTRNNAEKLTDYGVKVYIMKNAFVHSKLLLTENSVTVGSVNMDLRSFYQQFECGVYTDDKKVMEDVMKDFETTFSDCVLLTEKNKRRNNFIYRAFAGLMQLFAPFM